MKNTKLLFHSSDLLKILKFHYNINFFAFGSEPLKLKSRLASYLRRVQKCIASKNPMKNTIFSLHSTDLLKILKFNHSRLQHKLFHFWVRSMEIEILIGKLPTQSSKTHCKLKFDEKHKTFVS